LNNKNKKLKTNYITMAQQLDTAAEKVKFYKLLKGFDLTTQTIDEIGRHGIDSMVVLADFDPTQFDSFFTRIDKKSHPAKPKNDVVWVSAKGNEGIRLTYRWLEMQKWLGLKTSAEFLTPKGIKYVKKRDAELQASITSNADKDLARPPKFKSFAKWDDFLEPFTTFLGRILGAAKTPLLYVTRLNSDRSDDPRSSFKTTDEYFISCVVHSGAWFIADSKRVWDELKAACHGTSAWEFIKNFGKDNNFDGRGAFWRLKRAAETTNSSTLKILAAYKIINQLKWQASRSSHFTFENFIEKLVKAYNDLKAEQETVSEPKKVRDFLKAIEDDRLTNAKDFVMGDDAKMNNFELSYQYIQGILANKIVCDSASTKSRHAAALGSGGGFTGTLEGKSYPSDIWRTFTPEQIAEVRRLRAAASGGGGRGGGGRGRGGGKSRGQKRRAAAAKRKLLDENGDDDKSDEKSSGNQFGGSANPAKKRNGAGV